MKFQIFFAILLTGSAALAQTSEACRHRIIYLPQVHADHYGGQLHFKNSNFETAARSQFEVARFLMENKLPVFSEFVSTAQPARKSNGNFGKVAGLIKRQFPDGIPEEYSKMNGIQKLNLIHYGGDAMTSILKSSVESHQIPKLLFGRNGILLRKYVPQAEIDHVDQKRRVFALDQINEYFQKNQKQRDVVLIYDATQADGIRTHADKFPPHCILSPTENFQPPVTPPSGDLLISTRR